jgi:hypothetical protein
LKIVLSNEVQSCLEDNARCGACTFVSAQSAAP